MSPAELCYHLTIVTELVDKRVVGGRFRGLHVILQGEALTLSQVRGICNSCRKGWPTFAGQQGQEKSGNLRFWEASTQISPSHVSGLILSQP